MDQASSASVSGQHAADGQSATAARPLIAFRAGTRWLAVGAAQVREIARVMTAHRVPHRRDPRFLGLVNVRGELVPCIDIQAVLGMDLSPGDTPVTRGGHTWRRTMLLEQEGQAVAFHVDEVDALHQVQDQSLRPLLPDETAAAGRLTQAMVDLPAGPTALIDPDLFWYAVNEVWR